MFHVEHQAWANSYGKNLKYFTGTLKQNWLGGVLRVYFPKIGFIKRSESHYLPLPTTYYQKGLKNTNVLIFVVLGTLMYTNVYIKSF